MASIRGGAAGDRRSSSVTTREVARRSPERMRAISDARSARSCDWGLGLGRAMQLRYRAAVQDAMRTDPIVPSAAQFAAVVQFWKRRPIRTAARPPGCGDALL